MTTHKIKLIDIDGKESKFEFRTDEEVKQVAEKQVDMLLCRGSIRTLCIN